MGDTNPKSVEDLIRPRYSVIGYGEDRSAHCDEALQRTLRDKIDSIWQTNWQALWDKVKPTARPKTPLENDNCRIEKVTGWSKAVKEDSDDEYNSY